MKPMRIAENIVPLGEFKTHASRILREMKSAQSPFVITQNGKPAAVLLTPGEFDALNEQARFVGAVREGLADAKAGRTISDAEFEKELDAEFGGVPRGRK